MPRATWFCVDIECSGPVPALYDMISLGCVPVTGPAPHTVSEERFYVEIRPTAPRVDAGAMAGDTPGLQIFKNAVEAVTTATAAG